MNVEQIKAELDALWQKLLEIGSADPELLMFLSEVVACDVVEEDRYQLLSQMFEEVPQMLETLSNQADQFIQVLEDPPADAVTLRLFLEFRELFELFRSLTTVQLLHFTNNLLPPGSPDHQLHYFLELQALLVAWGPDALAQHHAELARTSLLQERSALLSRAPNTPVELLHVIVELLKLPIEELEAVRVWCENTAQSRIVYLVRLLQAEPAAVLHVKQVLAPDGEAPIVVSVPPAVSGAMIDDSSPPALISTGEEVSSVAGTPGGPQIAIATQPPVETVYNRLLKPYPAVSITGATNTNGLFVEAACVGADTLVEIALCLGGVSRVKLQSTSHAQFKKLKLAFTTQQQGTAFRLRFTLQQYQESGFVPVPGCVVYSRAITVFSHTQYLTRNNPSTPSQSSAGSGPGLSELIPTNGPPGSKLCILGAGFVRSPKLRVRVGDHTIVPTYHESGTLVCVVPPCNATRVAVSVTNNGREWSDSIMFTCRR